MTFFTWPAVADFVRSKLPAHRPVRVRPTYLSHPRFTAGFVEDGGLPPGEKGDWRCAYTDGAGLHVQECNDGTFLVHWDHVDPTCGVGCRIRHAAVDSPGVLLGGGSLIGGLIGSLGGSKGAAVGVIAGFVIAALIVVANQPRETSTGEGAS